LRNVYICIIVYYHGRLSRIVLAAFGGHGSTVQHQGKAARGSKANQ
jgi:hypothetical protein